MVEVEVAVDPPPVRAFELPELIPAYTPGSAT
jgi:hypothetical protein